MRLAKLMSCLSIALAFVALVTQPAWSQNGGSERAPLLSTSLGDNIYLLSGDGANIVAISDDKSVLLIDSGTADRVTELAHAVYQVTQRPVTMVFNTDWHSDHAGGNPYFSSFGVTIIAQANTRSQIATEYKAALKSYVAHNQSSFKVAVSPWSAAVENEASKRYTVRGVPTVAFDDNITVNLDTEELHFLHFSPAHTDGDTVVFLEKANILVLGDICPGHQYPWIDVASGGSLPGLIETVDRILTMSNEETRIVPAHGAVIHRTELQEYREMLATIQARIKALIQSGATPDQLLAAAPTSDFDADWGGGSVSGEKFTLSVLESMTSHDDPVLYNGQRNMRQQ